MKYLSTASVIFAALFLMSCGFSGKVKLDPVSEDFYETARLIMTKPEKDIFNHLPDKESREEFIEEFWAKRDPDPRTEENEFKEEFFRRIDYANQRFGRGVPGWKTDRGRIYIYLGPPDNIQEKPYINSPNIKGLIWWGYYKYKLGLEFVDRRGDGSYVLNQQMGLSGNVLQVIERAKFGQSFAEGQKEFMDFKTIYNSSKREILVSVPVSAIDFLEEEGILKADFTFKFFIYEKGGLKRDRFTERKSFEKPENEVLELEEIVFSFPFELEAGEYYFDVIVIVEPDVAKARKIIEIKTT